MKQTAATMTLSESYWPASNDVPLLDTTCGGVLREAAREWPQAIALIDADGAPGSRQQWTYAELLEASELLASVLLKNLSPGAHVAIWAANSPAWVLTQFAVAHAGMVLVTINPALTEAELAYVLKQSHTQAIFHQAEYRNSAMAEVIAAACNTQGITLEFVECFDALEDFAGSADRSVVFPVVKPSAAAMIQYTSGTTGAPKGALLSHHGITNNSRLMAELKALDSDTVNLAVAPLFHTAGCVANVLGTVQCGGTLLLPSAFDAASMLDLIEHEQVTYTFGVPTMLIALLAEQAARPRKLDSLQTVFSGAATVPVEVVKRVEKEFGVRLIIGYGQTETSPAITHTRLDDAPIDKSETIGYAIAQTEVKIVDPESGETLPVGQPGELCTRGFLLMLGYYDMPEATAKTIDGDGWLHTGDLCLMDARGYCRITGRLKDLIIRGGENIYPREIEEHLYTHPAIADVAVIGVPDDYWGEAVGAVITVTAGQPGGEELRAFLSDKLARHKIPTQWFILDSIPTTASGKLQKFRLVEMLKAGELSACQI